jgi:hypothetical protein
MRVTLLCAASATAALVLAGCGGRPGSGPTAVTPSPALAAGPQRVDPYRAAVAFARCMRAHGVAHPDPDRRGDFHLTPAQERRMRASATPSEHEAAEKACFHHLKGTVSTRPLSPAARRAALEPLRDLKRCLHGFDYDVGKPTVANLSRGRAKFGFDSGPQVPRNAAARERLARAQRVCERRVRLSERLDAIIKADREGF